MKKFIYVLTDIKNNTAKDISDYLLSKKRSVYIAHRNNITYASQAGVTSIQIESKNLTSKVFISDFKKILDTIYKEDWDYVAILPSTVFPLLDIDKFESFVAGNDIEYADIINGKFDTNIAYKKKFEEFYFPIGNAFIKKNITRFCKFLNLKKMRPYGFILHYGYPFGCFSRNSIKKMLSVYQDKRFCSTFKFLYHPAFYFIPTVFYKSIEQTLKPLSDIVLTTDFFVGASQYLYNDHESLMQSSNKYFVGKLSPHANTVKNKLPFSAILSNNINLSQVYIDKINSIQKQRIPGLYPSFKLQDLYYNNRDYNVIITDKKAENFIDIFDPQEYALYGHLLSRDRIDYGLMDEHPCYADNVMLRNYKIQNFLYDILNFSNKKVVFLLHPTTDDSIIDILAEDPHSKFFAYTDSEYTDILNLIIECTSRNKNFYYLCKMDIQLKNKQLSPDIDYEFLQIFIRKLNKIMYIKKEIIHFLENTKQ